MVAAIKQEAESQALREAPAEVKEEAQAVVEVKEEACQLVRALPPHVHSTPYVRCTAPTLNALAPHTALCPPT